MVYSFVKHGYLSSLQKALPMLAFPVFNTAEVTAPNIPTTTTFATTNTTTTAILLTQDRKQPGVQRNAHAHADPESRNCWTPPGSDPEPKAEQSRRREPQSGPGKTTPKGGSLKATNASKENLLLLRSAQEILSARARFDLSSCSCSQFDGGLQGTRSLGRTPSGTPRVLAPVKECSVVARDDGDEESALDKCSQNGSCLCPGTVSGESTRLSPRSRQKFVGEGSAELPKNGYSEQPPLMSSGGRITTDTRLLPVSQLNKTTNEKRSCFSPLEASRTPPNCRQRDGNHVALSKPDSRKVRISEDFGRNGNCKLVLPGDKPEACKALPDDRPVPAASQELRRNDSWKLVLPGEGNRLDSRNGRSSLPAGLRLVSGRGGRKEEVLALASEGVSSGSDGTTTSDSYSCSSSKASTPTRQATPSPSPSTSKAPASSKKSKSRLWRGKHKKDSSLPFGDRLTSLDGSTTPDPEEVRGAAVRFLGQLREREESLERRIKPLVKRQPRLLHDLFACTVDGWTPLHACTLRGSRALVKMALKAGVAPDLEMGLPEGLPGRCSPLHLAAHRGDLSLLRLLLRHGARVDKTDGAGRTPLYYAASRRNLLAVRKLLRHGADARDLTSQQRELCEEELQRVRTRRKPLSSWLCVPVRATSGNGAERSSSASARPSSSSTSSSSFRPASSSDARPR